MIILRQKHYATPTPTTPNNAAGGAGFFNKVGDFAKKTWNGENGLGKTGNRAALIGASAVTTLGAGAYINSKRKEKEEKERRGY